MFDQQNPFLDLSLWCWLLLLASNFGLNAKLGPIRSSALGIGIWETEISGQAKNA